MKTTTFSRVISLVLVFTMLFTMFVFTAGAKTTDEDLFTYVIEGETVTILKCSDKATGEVVIPAEIDGKTVTKIDKGAFEGCKSVTSLVIPEGVTVIGGETADYEIDTQDYMGLFVKDGLLYHLNFADAKAGTVINGSNPEAELASEKFGATADTYDAYYVYRADGITRPWSGGTATISEGGWKFLTPFIYSYWFDGEGNFKNARPHAVSTFDHFVTEPGLPETPYYMKGEEYVLSEAARKIGEETKPLYQLIHTAPKTATGYYISGSVWGTDTHSSAFYDGYFDLGKGGNVYLYRGGVKTALTASKAFSVEIVAASTQNKAAAFFIGPRFEFTPTASKVTFPGTANFEMLTALDDAKTTDVVEGYQTIQMELNGQKSNTYSFTFDLSDIANYNYTLNAYGNGTNYSTQNIVSKTNTFSVTGDGQWLMRGPGVNTYAMRVYEKELSAEEVLQNHFADIATIAKLDIKEFIKLSDTEKATVYEAFEGKTAEDDKAVLQLILDVATGVAVGEDMPVDIDYEDLFVKDSLIYHLNFASATEGTPIVSANPDAELAHVKFAAAADTYDAYYVYRAEGITRPWSGGTATISEGGWKFITPYIYGYWFNADGSLKNTGGSTATFANFVTEKGLAETPYYMLGEEEYSITENARTIGGETKPLYTLIHTAPENATGFYISSTVWANATYSSAFGNGYFDAGKGGVINLYQGNVYSTLSAAKGFTVELTAASTQYLNSGAGTYQKAAFFIGPRFEFTPSKNNVIFTGTANAEMISTLDDAATKDVVEGYQTIQMALNGSEINTYSFTFDMADIATKNYTLNAYGNGTNYSTQELVSTANVFKASGQYTLRGNGINNYAMRVYAKELSAEEVLQNHFADIATIAKLDISDFAEATAEEKAEVYAAFEGLSASTDKATLQRTLDDIVAPPTYYDLFVQDNLVYHLNFKDAKATDVVAGSAVFEDESKSAHERFVAAPSNFLPYTVYRMNGVGDAYIESATSTILPDWKFTTPYKYSWWFNEDGTATANSTTGTNKDAFVTSELTEKELTELETLTGFRPVLKSTSSRAFSGVTETLYHYLYQAPDGITNYYIGNGVWAGRYYATTFGDGYINLGSGTAPYIARAGASALIMKNNKFTLETTMASTNKFGTALYAGGARFSLLNANGITLSASDENLLGAKGSYAVAGDISTVNGYTLIVDGTKLSESSVDILAYLNGAAMGETITLATTKTALIDEFQYAPRGAGVNTYTLRFYNDVLTAEEVLQNHFADIVTINSLELDVEEFLAFTAEEKASVYAAFADKKADDDKAELQATLDVAIADITAVGMFGDCAALESVTVFAETAPELIEDAFKGAPLTEILVPEASVDAYKEAWPEYAELIAAYIPPATEPPVTTETPVTPEPPVSSEPAVTTQTPVETEPVIPTEIPYKANISMTLTDNGDGTFSADEIFGETNTFDFVEAGAGYAVGGAEAANLVDTTVSYAWDGQYIYVYAVTQDDTLFEVGADVAGDPNSNWSYDGFELWYYLGAAPAAKGQVRQFWASRLGYAMNAQTQVKSNYFNYIEWACECNLETGVSYMLFKIPAKTEEGTALKGGDVFYTEIQVDDNRAEDHSVYYCATVNAGDLKYYDAYVLADTGAGDIMYGDVNGDTQINAVDVVVLRKYMADFNFETGTSSVEVEVGADVNGDTTINAVDVVILRKYMADYDFETGSSSIVLGPSQNQ